MDGSDTTIEVVIRLAREEDLPGLEWEGAYAHYRSVFRRTFMDMQHGQRIMLVGVVGQVVVGQLFVQLVSSEQKFADGVKRAYLYALRVRPAWQGQGVGTRLIEAAEAALQARGFATAVIAAAKDNARALKLYQRLGYRIFAEDPGVWYFADSDGESHQVQEPCWVMEKHLK